MCAAFSEDDTDDMPCGGAVLVLMPKTRVQATQRMPKETPATIEVALFGKNDF